MELSRRATFIVAGLAWIVALFLLLPGLITVPVSLNDSRFVRMPSGSLSTRHYETLFTDPGWLSSFLDSLVIAAAAGVLATVLGTLCAVGLWRLSGKLVAIAGAIVLVPMLLPPVVAALAMYRTWVALGLYDTRLGVIIAHTIIALPYVVITVTTSLALLDGRLEHAARSLGASPVRAMRDVILPNIKGGVITGAIFAFIISWDEIVVTLFISTRAVYTLPRKMWDGIRENIDPTVAAVASLLMAMTVIGVAFAILKSVRKARSQPDSR
jgi:putative spermidine/putrescine transport system permease protein